MPKKVVVITGASSGIGEVFARKLASEHDLLLVARRRERLEALAAELGRNNESRIEVLEADLMTEKGVVELAARLENDPRLVLLVNNAGFGTKGRFWEAPLEGQEDMHRLHVMAPLRLMHAALRNMVKRDSGAIINVASVAAFVRNPGSASYCATKSWMTVFTESVHLELKSAGSAVKVQALCPGFTYSEFHEAMGVERSQLAPRSMWLSAEEVVEASLRGLEQDRLFVIPGWRYRWLVSILTKLPIWLRLATETRTGRRRGLAASSGTTPSARISSQNGE